MKPGARSIQVRQAAGDPFVLAVDERHLVGEAGRPNPALPTGEAAVPRGADPLLRGHSREHREETIDEAIRLLPIAAGENLVGERLLDASMIVSKICWLIRDSFALGARPLREPLPGARTPKACKILGT